MVGFSDSMQFVAADSCLSTTVDGESVILHMDAGTYYGFNEVGTYVWESLQEPRTVGELCQEIHHEYDVAYEQCRSDINELLRELLDKDLVRRASEHSE